MIFYLSVLCDPEAALQNVVSICYLHLDFLSVENVKVTVARKELNNFIYLFICFGPTNEPSYSGFVMNVTLRNHVLNRSETMLPDVALQVDL